MKKKLNLAVGFFLIVAAGGAANCFFILDKGAGLVWDWLIGGGPLLFGGLIATTLLVIKEELIIEGKCPNCGKTYSQFARRQDRIVRGVNIRCDCGRILWLPLGRERTTMF